MYNLNQIWYSSLGRPDKKIRSMQKIEALTLYTPLFFLTWHAVRVDNKAIQQWRDKKTCDDQKFEQEDKQMKMF